jgi:DeoR family ulaG and ulaABCDEF operon transcriptional repressor
LTRTEANIKSAADAPDIRGLHATERERTILSLLAEREFVAIRDLERRIDVSSATLRRDLRRLATEGRLSLVRGGARPVEDRARTNAILQGLQGVPFHENIHKNIAEKQAIGRAAAALCSPGEGVMIDGGSTTLQMCPHLGGKNLQVLTTSLHIVSALLPQPGTRIQVPGGTVFREQNLILCAARDDLMPRFHAPKLFMGAAAVGPQGVMQADIVLVASERRLIERAEELILLVDSSKFHGASGNVVCGLDEADILISDSGITSEHQRMLANAGVRLIIA